MRFSSAVVLAAASAVSASYNDTGVVYTTQVSTVYTTVCPAGGSVTYGGSNYVNTETYPSTVIIDVPTYTVVYPVYTASSVYCNTCYNTPAPVYPTTNGTAPAPPAPTSEAAGTTYVPVPTTTPVIPASGANKAFAMSGSLVAVLGLAAYLL